MFNRFFELLTERAGRPLVIAHRGDSYHAPESTLEAGRLGWEAGADAWELDVQLTRDGVPIVFHDEVLTRTTNAAARFAGDPRAVQGYRVGEFDWSEIAELDAGAWFAARPENLANVTASHRDLYQSGSVRVPTLRQALALTSALDWLVNIELKSFPDRPGGLVEAVLRVVGETDSAHRVLLSSFDHRELARAEGLLSSRPDPVRSIPRGVLVSSPLHRPHDYVRQIVGAETFHISAAALGSESTAYLRRPAAGSLWQDELAELKAAGIPVLVYTVNDHRLGTHLAELGVDAVFTDDPTGMKARLG